MDIGGIKARLSRMGRQKRSLEQKINDLQRKEFLALPKHVGLDSIDSLIIALLRYASPPLRSKLQSLNLDESHETQSPAGCTDAKRARFSSDIKTRIKAELLTGTKSVATLSREYGPSHPTIMGWKREWGMTHPRGKRSGNGSK